MESSVRYRKPPLGSSVVYVISMAEWTVGEV
jgi:hypothetical protein